MSDKSNQEKSIDKFFATHAEMRGEGKDEHIALLEKEIVEMSKDNIVSEYTSRIYREALVEIAEDNDRHSLYADEMIEKGDKFFAGGRKSLEGLKEVNGRLVVPE